MGARKDTGGSMTDETVGAWDAQNDPNPEPGQPPRNVTPLQRQEPPGASARPHERDPNAPPADRQTVKSFGGGALPVRNYPKRCMWLTLPAPYDEYHVYAWVNAPDLLVNKLAEQTADVRSPDDPRVNPDDPDIDPNAFELDPTEYGINEVERQARIAESARRTREVQRRKVEKAKRQREFEAAQVATSRFMGEIVMEHDIPDMEGKLHAADTQAFWDFAEGELQGVIMGAVRGQRGKLNPTNARR